MSERFTANGFAAVDTNLDRMLAFSIQDVLDENLPLSKIPSIASKYMSLLRSNFQLEGVIESIQRVVYSNIQESTVDISIGSDYATACVRLERSLKDKREIPEHEERRLNLLKTDIKLSDQEAGKAKN